eukprot:CAMPEP_0117435958 /NCGR_PEP_ID=MMETSP0759-20121206/761_1 /TAXON_ID=63605 /ORGANISM="Percolomonas cosmopolitus, Strain WS" /LENGTH=678 /DNA_ID=CAMNT_0005227545 /DNA_START=411 /DNA_END=2444 /DNA_ORIENTATION=+
MLELYKFNITPQLVDIYLKLIPQSYANKLHVPFYFLQYYVPVVVKEPRNAAQSDGRAAARDNSSNREQQHETLYDENGLPLVEENVELPTSNCDPDNDEDDNSPSSTARGTSHRPTTNVPSPSASSAGDFPSSKRIKYMSVLYTMLGFIYQYTLFEDNMLHKRRRLAAASNPQSYYMNDFFDSPEDEFLDEMDFYEILRDERVKQEQQNQQQVIQQDAQQNVASSHMSDGATKTSKHKKVAKKHKEDNVTYLHVKTNHDQILELGQQLMQQRSSSGKGAESVGMHKDTEKNVGEFSAQQHQHQHDATTNASSTSPTPHRRRVRISSLLSLLNSVRGVFKFYATFSTKERLSFLFMNYLDILFLDKKYKMALSTRLKDRNLFLKILLRRSFRVGKRKFFYSISAWNMWYVFVCVVHEVMHSIRETFGLHSTVSPLQQRQHPTIRLSLLQRLVQIIETLSLAHSISYKNYRIRFKSFPLSNSKKFSITKQGWQKIPLSQKRILSRWKFYNERFEREFSNAYERELYSYNDNWIELWKWLQLLLYAVQQSAKMLYYLVRWNISSFKGHVRKSVGRIKSFILVQYFEQLFALSSGYYSKVSTEVSWRVMPNNTTQYGLRIPLEWHWGCDLFRIWIYMDAISEYWMDNHKESLVDVLCSSPSKPFFHPLLRRPLKELPGVSQW